MSFVQVRSAFFIVGQGLSTILELTQLGYADQPASRIHLHLPPAQLQGLQAQTITLGFFFFFS